MHMRAVWSVIHFSSGTVHLVGEAVPNAALSFLFFFFVSLLLSSIVNWNWWLHLHLSVSLFSLTHLSSYVTYTHMRLIFEMMHCRKNSWKTLRFPLKSRGVHTTPHAVIICTLVYIYLIIGARYYLMYVLYRYDKFKGWVFTNI